MLGGMSGKRKRGRPGTRWIDTLKNMKGPTIKIIERERGKEGGREEGRKGGMEGGREGGRERGREGERERGR